MVGVAVLAAVMSQDVCASALVEARELAEAEAFLAQPVCRAGDAR